MNNNHKVIIIPGLGDNVRMMELLTNHWEKHGLEVIIHTMGWRSQEQEFLPKLSRLTKLIDSLYDDCGSKVSVVGTSAGGSAALNALIERCSKIHKVINVCGRLSVGQTSGFRGFDKRTATSHSFAESVKFFESQKHLLRESDRQKAMTVRAMFGDELVPASTAVLDGARNITIPTTEHIISISAALTIFSKTLIRFLMA